MIVCNETEQNGRLGNQLWRIASTIGIALSRGDAPAFPASWSYREWFSIPDEWFYDELPEGPSSSSVSGLRPVPADYLQDLGLWKNHYQLIRNCFTPSRAAWGVLDSIAPAFFGELDYESPILSVHVRRSDNLTNDPGTINCLPMTYYLEAAAAASVLASEKLRGLAIFTDDFEWCSEELAPILPFDNIGVYRGVPRPKENGPDYVGSPASDWIDLQMMALCDYHVLSNSTYSWWGAFLAESGKVVYPSYWYGGVSRSLGLDPSLMFPASWHKIEVEDPNPC